MEGVERSDTSLAENNLVNLCLLHCGLEQFPHRGDAMCVLTESRWETGLGLETLI